MAVFLYLSSSISSSASRFIMLKRHEAEVIDNEERGFRQAFNHFGVGSLSTGHPEFSEEFRRSEIASRVALKADFSAESAGKKNLFDAVQYRSETLCLYQ